MLVGIEADDVYVELNEIKAIILLNSVAVSCDVSLTFEPTTVNIK